MSSTSRPLTHNACLVGGVWGRPQVVEDAVADQDACSSCREVVGFVRRLLDTNDASDVERNLTDWCQNEGPAAPRQVVSRTIAC